VGQQGTGATAAGLAGSAAALSIAVGSNASVAINASAAGSIPTGQTIGSAWAKAAAINASGVAGLTATADTTLMAAFSTVVAADYKLVINGTAIANGDYSTNNITGASMAQLINQNQSATGVSATFSNGNMTLNAADGRDIIVTQSNAAGSAATATGLGAVTNAAGRTNNTVNAALTSFGTSFAAQSAVGSIRLSAFEQITVSGTAVGAIGYGATSYALGNAALSSATVATVSQANTTINQVDAALTAVNGLRATFGSIQNRFDSVIASLTATAENVTAARSRIQDADFAQETANLTRAQILQQAGTAMLAQANAVPNNVLTLLKG
jgi:flagellin